MHLSKQIIIKPIETLSEFDSYANVRYSYNYWRNSTFTSKNISKAKDKHEFDAYDLNSFHFGIFKENELCGCARVVSDVLGERAFVLDNSSKQIIQSLSYQEAPTSGLPLQDYVKENKYVVVEDFFHSLRLQGKKLNEAGRLIQRLNGIGDNLINYLICYVFAYMRYHNFDLLFFNAVRSHCLFYQRFFNCKHVLQNVEFSQLDGEEPLYLMQANVKDLPERMNIIVNRILVKFNTNKRPCAIKIEEII